MFNYETILLKRLRLAGITRSYGEIDRISRTASGLQSATLWHLESAVGIVAFLDRRDPAFGVVLPLPAYDLIAATLCAHGDHLWTTEFKNPPPGTALEEAAIQIAARLHLTVGESRTPIPTTRIDPFDTSFDRLTCPFLFVELTTEGAGVAATPRPASGAGSGHETG